MANIHTSSGTELLAQESTASSMKDFLDKANMMSVTQLDTLERIQQQLAQVTGVNLNHEERIDD